MYAQIAAELGLNTGQVENLDQLFETGATVPFIARYRKETTGNLDEVQVRDVMERLEYLRELADRKQTILKSIEEQGKLTPELNKQVSAALTKQSLEDLYLPYKPKRRTRAMIAKQAGLEPLALLMLSGGDMESWFEGYQTPEGVERDIPKLTKMARDILAEQIAEDPEPKDEIRRLCRSLGGIQTEIKPDFEKETTKFDDYRDFTEPVQKIAAHRYLAIRRGEEEGVLRMRFELPEDHILDVLCKKWMTTGCLGDQVKLAVQDAWGRLLSSSMEVELRLDLKEKADLESIGVFGKNMRDLMLAPLGGQKVVIGLDPGFRSGTKWVVIDTTGKPLDHGAIFPVEPQNQVGKSEQTLLGLIQKHQVEVICLGNGTASREVFGFLRSMLKENGLTEKVTTLIVSESGASIYSASDIAREEFPDLDLTIRGAISIARRFQDPLAELVKLDPKSVGVGQYQHDVNQRLLKKRLDEVVESCVNHVGVNLNTASAPLLSYVAGMSTALASSVVAYRDGHGGFHSRKELLKVARFGPKTFEQAAGFLRLTDGTEPLDRSAVHPENYKLVQQMAADVGLKTSELLGDEKAIEKIQLKNYLGENVGMLTLTDIVKELKKPGRDPRSAFVAAKLMDEIQKISDLKPGMTLEGTITNLTKFGAFVDIGVHQDGLMHLSEMADKFIRDPSEICSVGQVVKVRVLAVDVHRKRISLSAKTERSGDSAVSAAPALRAAPIRPEPEKSFKSSGNFQTDVEALAKRLRGE